VYGYNKGSGKGWLQVISILVAHDFFTVIAQEYRLANQFRNPALFAIGLVDFL